MAFVTVTMPDGRSWTPKFVGEINQQKCIGCGRCFRVCGRDVLQLVGVTEDGEFIPVVLGSDDDDDEDGVRDERADEVHQHDHAWDERQPDVQDHHHRPVQVGSDEVLLFAV